MARARSSTVSKYQPEKIETYDRSVVAKASGIAATRDTSKRELDAFARSVVSSGQSMANYIVARTVDRAKKGTS